MRLRARHFETGEPTDLIIEDQIIRAIEPATDLPADRVADWVGPALFDLQINGCGGFSFNSQGLTREQIRHVVATCRSHGIGGFCPTLITAPTDALVHGFDTLAKACAEEPDLERAMPVFHLEGPFISPEEGPRGAHPLHHVRLPDWDEFRRLEDAAAGRIRLVTLAPELAGGLSFIERLTASGIVVALGHTAAGPACIRDAVRAGARLSTHLGNGSHASLPRHENYFLEQLAADELQASIICDGHHLPPALVKIITRVKGPDRLILTSDTGSLAGLPPGRYREWDQELEVTAEGSIVLPGTTFLAGSGSFTDQCVLNMASVGGVSLKQAHAMASTHPRRLLGLPAPKLAVGERAELFLYSSAGVDV